MDETFCTADAWRIPPTIFKAQRNGCPWSFVPVQVIFVSRQIIEKVPPPASGCRMLKSVGFLSWTTGEPSGIMGELVPSGDSKTGHIPTGAVPEPDQSAQSTTGKVS